MAAESAERVARLHSVEDVMGRLRLGRSKTYEVLGNGQLRSVKVGRRRLISEAAIVDFINRLEAGDVALTGGDDAA
jgi:excisionase family DNA binding protein